MRSSSGGQNCITQFCEDSERTVIRLEHLNKEIGPLEELENLQAEAL